jgi:hypothetical protein
MISAEWLPDRDKLKYEKKEGRPKTAPMIEELKP